MPRRIFTDTEKRNLVELWHAGEPVPAMAAALGTSPQALASLAWRLRKEGWDLPERQGGSRLTPTQLRQRLEVARAAGDTRTIEVLELRLSGLTPKEIGERLGVTAQQVTRRIADPDRAKGRAGKWQWRGSCEVCGAPTRSRTSVGDPKGPHRHRQVLEPARLCDTHAREARWGHPELTRDAIVAGLQMLARHLDRTPKISDLRAPGAPFGVTQVYRVFGKRGFTRALTAAGLVARKVGGQKAEDEKATEITWEQRASVLRLGGSLTFDGTTVSEGLKAVGECR